MQRNGQNPIKSSVLPQKAASTGGTHASGSTAGGAPHCPACGTEVPLKPGFRVSSLKCPKCGASMGKK